MFLSMNTDESVIIFLYLITGSKVHTMQSCKHLYVFGRTVFANFEMTLFTNLLYVTVLPITQTNYIWNMVHWRIYLKHSKENLQKNGENYSLKQEKNQKHLKLLLPSAHHELVMEGQIEVNPNDKINHHFGGIPLNMGIQLKMASYLMLPKSLEIRIS